MYDLPSDRQPCACPAQQCREQQYDRPGVYTAARRFLFDLAGQQQVQRVPRRSGQPVGHGLPRAVVRTGGVIAQQQRPKLLAQGLGAGLPALVHAAVGAQRAAQRVLVRLKQLQYPCLFHGVSLFSRMDSFLNFIRFPRHAQVPSDMPAGKEKTGGKSEKKT